jgi:hypothetical protein
MAGCGGLDGYQPNLDYPTRFSYTIPKPITVSASSVITTDAVIAQTGAVVFGTGASDGTLYYLDAAGSLLWKYPKVFSADLGRIDFNPFILPNSGNVVFSDIQHSFIASLSPDSGAVVWKSPALAVDMTSTSSYEPLATLCTLSSEGGLALKGLQTMLES